MLIQYTSTDGEIDTQDNLSITYSSRDQTLESMSFTLRPCDTLFVLTKNNSIFKENVANIVSKMVVVNEERIIPLDDLSEVLGGIGIKTLNIFSIFSEEKVKSIFTTDKGCHIKLIDIDQCEFGALINHPNQKFLNYNKHSLYILREGNYLDIKNIFSFVDKCQVNLGRGGSQN